MNEAAKQRQRKLLEEAWVGDAVLTLFARRYILGQESGINNGRAARMTSNRFLEAIGNATAVEAQIGRVYEAEGLDAAFAWIQRHLIPLHEKQERRLAPPPRTCKR
jgi:dsRNA-specific ribonuclease